MREFLSKAAACEPGKGILVAKLDRATAGRAVSAGYGWMIEAPLKVFIIEDAGRLALAEAAAP